MKKFLLSLALTAAACVCIPSGASAQSFVAPPQGVINMAEYPAGCGAFTIRFPKIATPNRENPKTVELMYNGSSLKSVSSADASVSMQDGFDKVTSSYEGVIDFWHVTTPDNLAITPGNYTLTVPEGFFLYEDGTPVPSISGEWQIKGTSVTLTPASSSVVTSISTITATFKDAEKVTFTDNTTTETAYDDEGVAHTYKVYAVVLEPRSSDNVFIPTVTVEGNKVIYTFDPPVEDPGKYDFSIKAGSVSIYDADGTMTPCSTVDAIFHIELELPAPDIEPVEGQYSVINPTREGTNYAFFRLYADEKITYTLNSYARFVPVTTGAGTSTNFYIMKNPNNVKGMILVDQKISERTKDQPFEPVEGDYVLIVPAKSYQTASGMNSEYRYYYTFRHGQSSVTLLQTGDEGITVYTPTGVCVARNASTDILSSLPAGIYIVNGKKIAIR